MHGLNDKFMVKLCYGIKRQYAALKLFKVKASWKLIGKTEEFH